MTFSATSKNARTNFEGDPGQFRFYPAPRPPANMTVQAIPPSAPNKFLVTLIKNGTLTHPTVLFRVYYLSAAEYYGVNNQPPLLTANKLKSLSHFVFDLKGPGQQASFTVPVDAYLAGGWFYAVAVGSDGTEGPGTGFVALPLFFATGVPIHEITSPNYVPWFAGTSRIGPDGLHYRDIIVTWLTAAFNPDTTGARYIQIYVQNYANMGQLWEGPQFNNPQRSSFVGKGIFTLECDDGTGGFPNPGAHNVKLYFVSVSSAGVRRTDPLSSPNVTITGGIFS